MLVCTTFRIDMPEKPRSVLGSAAAAEVDQVPTQAPAEAGAAEPRAPWARESVPPWSPRSPMNIAVETRITTAASAASTAYPVRLGIGGTLMSGLSPRADGARGSGVDGNGEFIRQRRCGPVGIS
ncbi:hypothetical protein TPA0910_24120 [Streptomyces hygroscopicus subsp. sporocinereus]|uniref:Uncharacterized protein n=1 Tax=Streptomyces hygroscopicus TaxID=1912 RepID=A0ABQ3TXB1_STRHY|nr:hypothetical protein TPA0910_24120 [Streptomyces hygroscopicus]GLV79966.1 hypothetical protein Shyhy02_79660 [Streptomyces hygroscopicus subsp. hygroscopicus]